MTLRNCLSLTALGVLALLNEGCATVGRAFHFEGPQEIQVGKTTRKEVLNTFGAPFQIGYDDGLLKYTYGYYKYRVFGDNDTKDLTIVFTAKDVVQRYSYATSIEEEKKRLPN